MAVIGTLAVNIVARTDRFVSGIAKSRGLAKGFTAVLGAVGAAATAATVTLTKLGQSFEQLNQSMTSSLAIMGDVSAGMRDKMTKAAIEVSRTTKFSAAEAAKGYYFLAAAGLDAKQSLAALPQVGKFAAAGNFDLALATDLATDAQSALGLTVKDSAQNLTNLTRVTDVLIKANTMANASAEQFATSLTTKAGVAMRQIGMDIEEGVSILAAYADQGTKAQEAGTALGIVLRDLQTKALLNSAAFKEAGIAVYDSHGEFRRMVDILKDLERRLEGASDAQKKHTLLSLGFADKSVGYLQSIIGLSDKIAGYETQLRSAGGFTQMVADKQMTSMQKALAKLGAAWESVASQMGPLVEEIAIVVEAFAGFGSGSSGATAIILALADAIFYLRMGVSAAAVAMMDLYIWNQKFLGVSDDVINDVKVTKQFAQAVMMGEALAGTPSERHRRMLEQMAKETEKAGEKIEESLTPKQSFVDKWRQGLLGAKAEISGFQRSLEQMRLDQALFDLSFGFAGKNYRGKGGGPAAAAAMGQRGTLAFAQAGSADSYRQQAAMRRQNEPMMQIAKQQLKAQERIAKAVEKQANGADDKVANF